MEELSYEMQQVNATLSHIRQVQELLCTCITDLNRRATDHDKSKFCDDEWLYFLTHTKTLAGLTYGSPEYKEALEEMRPAIENHYIRNRHHPEHHTAWIRDMNLIDLLEMICDWIAATKRHSDGDIFKSIELNQKRFNYSFELKAIFENTVREITRSTDSNESQLSS